MGYFANSTEASLFYETYCVRCKNNLLNDCCAIWELHHDWGYKLVNSKSLAKKFLDYLIDNEGADISKWKCRMFNPKIPTKLEKRIKKS